MADNHGISFESVEVRGMYAGLTVNGLTGVMTSFFDKLPQSYGNPINPVDAHVTIVEPAESAIDVFSSRDLISLTRAGHEIASHLGHLPLSSLVIYPDEDQLRKYKRHVGIPIKLDAFMEDMRGFTADIVEKELGVKLSNRYEPHMSVTRIRRGKPNLRPHFPPVPSRYHLTGYDVGQRSLTHQSGRSRSRQSFVNKPGGRS